MYAKHIEQEPQLRKIWQIAIVIFITISIPLGLIVLKLTLDFRSGAGPTEEPDELIISNITDTSAVVSFETGSTKTKAIVDFGEEGTTPSNPSFDERSTDGTETYYLHYHKLVDLKPNTKYVFEINVGAETYDSEDYSFKTLPTSESMPIPIPVNGKVGGTNFSEGIVYAHLTNRAENSLVVSSLLPSSGAYALDLSSAKKKDGKQFDSDASIVVFINGAKKGRGYTVGTHEEQLMDEIVLSVGIDPYDPDKLDYAPITGTPPTTTKPSITTIVTEQPTSQPTNPSTTKRPTQNASSPTPAEEGNLTITNLKDNDEIVQGGIIFGTGRPSSIVTFELGGSTIGTATVGLEKQWQFTIPENSPVGPTQLTIENEGDSIVLNIIIKDMDDLPETAIGDFIRYIPGLIILVFGLYLTFWTKEHNRWEDRKI